MAVENFKQTLWEGALLAQFHGVSIADLMVTRPTRVNGDKVIFNKVKKGAIKDYTGTVDWADVETEQVELTFPKKKYFAFKVDDVDRVQLAADLIKPITDEHAAALAEVYDADFFTELTGASGSTKLGTKTAQKDIHAKNVYDFVVDLGTELSKKKCPKTDRFVTVSAEILGLLSKDPRFTNNPVVLENGLVEGQKINGLQVMVSEELPKNQVVAHHKSAIGGAKQLSETEAFRLQGSIGDGVRGLWQYGFKVLREEAIAILHYKIVETPLAK